MATVSTAEYIYKVDDGNYTSGLNNMSKSTDDLDGKSSSLDGTLNVLNSTYVKVGGSIGAFVVAMNKSTNAILTNSLNYAELQANLELTDEETQNLIKTQEQLGVQYGFNRTQVAQITALNSEYTSSTEQLSQANELAFQTANLYALKEGDLSVSTDQLITSTEALRDVILTGSTTAFEDGAISIEAYRDALIEANGWTQDEADAIAEGTNGVFEYTEALSKASPPTERFNALSDATSQELEGVTENLGFAAQSSLFWQQNITRLQNGLGTLVVVLVYVVAKIILFIVSTTKAIISSDLFQKALSILVTVVQKLIDILTALAPTIITIAGILASLLIPIINLTITAFGVMLKILVTLWAQLLVQLIPVFVLLAETIFYVFQALQPLIVAILQLAISIIQFLAPVLSILISLFVLVATIVVAVLSPILITLANIISIVLTPIIQILTVTIQILTVIFQAVATVVMILADVINALLVIAISVLDTVIQAILSPLRIMNDLFNKGVSLTQHLANTISGALKTSLETILVPIEAVIDVFEKLLDIIINVTNAILDGLIGAFNSIPFVPNIGESSASIGATTSSSNVNNSNTSNANYSYTINTKNTPTMRQLVNEQRFTKYHGGTYAT